uniref:Uncharacterized protein n=1 Tax=Arundo donax TaxID=35708 RepID=A0A0A9BD04_ARUDO
MLQVGLFIATKDPSLLVPKIKNHDGMRLVFVQQL